MSQYQTFIFESYVFDPSAQRLELNYSLDGRVHFQEVFSFNFDLVAYDPNQLDRALQNLFFMAGVSYYKAYLPSSIEIRAGTIDASTTEFLATTYQKGLGEFFYVNQINPTTVIPFAPNVTEPIQLSAAKVQDGLLVGLGGGKDSLVTIELLRNQPRVATWSLGHQAQLQPLIDRVGLPHFNVEREWDRSLLRHNEQGALNGHVPISSIFATVGTVVGILAGYSQTVVSNENSANEPTLTYQGEAINHQYSKSLAFETAYQRLLFEHFGDAVQYYSFLRPLSELHIAKVFAEKAFTKYHDVFSSCNRAFVHTSTSLWWCGECPKCAFVFLALTPFIPRDQLEALWGGKNLLLDPNLEPLFKNLIGTEGDKPLECVGEIKESRSAMRLAQQQYPELSSYEFDIPADYDYLALAPHSMPSALYELLVAELN